METSSKSRPQRKLFVAVWISATLSTAAVADVVRIEFNNLPYPDGHNMTNEWEADGIVFTDDAAGMDPAFPCVSLGWQENRVQGGLLWNLFRINFVADGPVVEVVCEFRDQNSRDQIHTLYELDSDLNIVQQVEYDDLGGPEFSLRLTNPNGIYGIAACEQPYGAELFKAIEFTVESCDSCDMNCDGTVDASDIEFFIDILFNGATPCGTCTGDTNGDGSIDAGDIEGFINCLFP